jgi:hypothetical protein
VSYDQLQEKHDKAVGELRILLPLRNKSRCPEERAWKRKCLRRRIGEIWFYRKCLKERTG